MKRQGRAYVPQDPCNPQICHNGRIGSAGCNIQSIEIDHITEDRAVLSLVLTDEGDVGKLSAQLIGAGFSVSFNPLSPKEHIHVD